MLLTDRRAKSGRKEQKCNYDKKTEQNELQGKVMINKNGTTRRDNYISLFHGFLVGSRAWFSFFRSLSLRQCEEQGLDTKGTKAVLVARLQGVRLEAGPQNWLSSLIIAVFFFSFFFFFFSLSVVCRAALASRRPSAKSAKRIPRSRWPRPLPA